MNLTLLNFRPAERFLAGSDGFGSPGNCRDLVTHGDDFLLGPVRIAAPASDVLGLAFFLSLEAVTEQPFDSELMFRSELSRHNKITLIISVVVGWCSSIRDEIRLVQY
jgi:hypothetical protein